MKQHPIATRTLRACLALAALLSALPGRAEPSSPGASPLTLDAALTQAKARSGSLKAKQLEVARSGYATKEAQTKALPSFGLTASSTYMTDPPKGIKIAQGAFANAPIAGSEYPVFVPDQDYVLIKDTEHTYFKIQASMDQVLWTWGKIEKAVEISRLDEQAAAVSLRASERDLARDLAKAYFGAILARDSLASLREAKLLMDGMVEDQRSSLAEGAINRQDLLEAVSKASELGYQVARAEEGLATGLDALEFYLGRRPAAEDLVTPFRDSLPDLDEAALKDQALAASTEVEALSIKARQATLARQIREASLAGIPDFSLKVTYDITGQKIPFVGGNWTDSWSGNLLLTLGGKVELYDSLASVWRLEEAKAQEGAAKAGLEELSRSSGIQVRRLVEAARTGAALVAQNRAAVELSAERAKNAAISKQNELITRAEESGAKVADISARLALLLARFQTESALLDLEHDTGRNLPR